MRPNGDIPLGFCQCGCGQKTNISDKTRPARGYVKGEPFPFIYNHSKSKGRLDNYVVEDRGYVTPCWIWQGATTEKGYGHIRLNGKMVSVHRTVYEQRVGPIPDGMEIDHLCKTRSCMNTDHFEVVTGLVNIRRGRHVKLSYEDIAEIIRLRDKAYWLIREIAYEFNVSEGHIKRVLRERR